MDRTAAVPEGLGDAALAFLRKRLEDCEARMNGAPLGSVARAEASEEAREIRIILETDRRKVEAAGSARVAPLTGVMDERSIGREPEACPSCRTLRVGAFRFCRSCGHDYESDLAGRRAPIAARAR